MFSNDYSVSVSQDEDMKAYSKMMVSRVNTVKAINDNGPGDFHYVGF